MADTCSYTPVQKKAAEIIAGAGAIAQFLDRDTRPDFAGPHGMQGFLQTSSATRPGPGRPAASIQDFWDTLPPQ